MLAMKELRHKEKKFLEFIGLDSEQFLFISKGADYYKFYYKNTGKEVCIRR